MKTSWLGAAATPVLWIGVAVLLWALGARLLLAIMDGVPEGVGLDLVVRAALVVALVTGVAFSRRSPDGYLVLAFAGAACAVRAVTSMLEGSFLGTVTLIVAALTVVAAIVRWLSCRTTAGAPRSEAGTSARVTPRSPVDAAAAWSLGIAGLLVLARVLVELVARLAELPGASEHWAGDVVLWLIFVLPIPTLAGATLLFAASWLVRHRVGPGRAAVAWLATVAVATTWLLADVGFMLGQGNYVRPLEDPLLWAPIAMLAGSAAGVLLPVAIEAWRHLTPGAHPSHG